MLVRSICVQGFRRSPVFPAGRMDGDDDSDDWLTPIRTVACQKSKQFISVLRVVDVLGTRSLPNWLDANTRAHLSMRHTSVTNPPSSKSLCVTSLSGHAVPTVHQLCHIPTHLLRELASAFWKYSLSSVGDRIGEMFSMEGRNTTRRFENGTTHNETETQNSNSVAMRSQSHTCRLVFGKVPQAAEAVCWHAWKTEANHG